MKKTSKPIALVMAILIAVSVFTASVFATNRSYNHPNSVFTLEGGAGKADAKLVSVGEIVYSNVINDGVACYKIYSPAKTLMAFSFKAAYPINVTISQLGSSAETKLVGQSSYNETVAFDNAYYYITVSNYVAPTTAPTTEPTTEETTTEETTTEETTTEEITTEETTTEETTTEETTLEETTLEETTTKKQNLVPDSALSLMSDNNIVNPFYFTTAMEGMPKEFTAIINHSSADLISGETLQLKITNSSMPDLNIYWRSVDNPETLLVNEAEIVTVNKDGLVRVMSNSTSFNKNTEVKVQAVMYYNGEEWTKTCTINAIPSNINLNPYFDHLGSNNLTLGVGAVRTVKATSNISGAIISWETENENVATVVPTANGGQITAKGVGETKIIVTATTPTGATIGRYITVEVLEDYTSVVNVKFDVKTGSIRVCATSTLKRTITTTPGDIPNADVKIEFKSDNPAIATVDKDGKVTGVAVGTTKITVTVTDGKYSFSDTYDITVKEQLPNWIMVVIAPLRIIYNLIMMLLGKA